MSDNNSYDLIILGAGINGSGIARDATLRRLRVLLLDKDDVSSGTSSRSTRLIHGGLRYLEHRELGLVRESLRERETLLQIAPHLVRALPILVPNYEWNRRGKTTVRAGMFAYDLLSYDRSLPGHKSLSRTAVSEMIPGLQSEGLSGGAVFYDAQVEFAERLVLENALAAVESGATLVTHAKLEDFGIENELITTIRYVQNGKSNTAFGRIFLNTTGPWIDQVLKLTDAASPRLIGGSKGSHLVVAAFPSAPSMAIYLEAEADGRPFFILPWNGCYLIGTTDIRYDGNIDEVHIENREIHYLLRETNRAFPNANLTKDKIYYTYSGVRPLPFTPEENEEAITRRHFIRQHPRLSNLFSIVGGKLTTYRSLAEDAVDLAFRRLNLPVPACLTAKLPLPGANKFQEAQERMKDESHLSDGIRSRLLRIYGSRAVEVNDLASQSPTLSTPLSSTADALSAEVVFCFDREYAQTLTDCLLRRTMLGLNSNLAIGEDITAAAVAQRHLGWSADKVRSEVENYRKYIERFRIDSVT